MTLFGDVITPHGGQVWLGTLIELMAPFGVNDRLVRTSVFRLTEEGWLEARREGRRSQYALNTAAAERFEHAYQRIYTPVSKEWDGKWLLAFAVSGAINAEQRARLRKELFWQGFGSITTGVYIRPSNDVASLAEIVDRVGVERSVFISQVGESDLPTARPLRELVDECWELQPIIEDYQHLIDSFSSLLKLLAQQKVLEPKHAFMLRTLVIHAFRRVHLHDPLPPLELLPANWPGRTAYELCHDIYQATFRAAEEHITETLVKEDEATAEPAPYFYHRFGGLV